MDSVFCPVYRYEFLKTLLARSLHAGLIGETFGQETQEKAPSTPKVEIFGELYRPRNAQVGFNVCVIDILNVYISLMLLSSIWFQFWDDSHFEPWICISSIPSEIKDYIIIYLLFEVELSEGVLRRSESLQLAHCTRGRPAHRKHQRAVWKSRTAMRGSPFMVKLLWGPFLLFVPGSCQTF